MKFFKKDAMLNAVCDGDIETVAAMLDAGVSPNAERDWTRALEFAIKHQQLETASLLLERGAYIQEDYVTEAIRRGQVEMVSLLAHYNAKIGMSDAAFAAKLGDLNILAWIFEKKSHLLQDINQQNDGETALHQASIGGYANIVKYLLEMGADPNIEDYQYRTPLFRAQEKTHKEVEALLSPITKSAIGAHETGWKKLSDEKVALVSVEPEIGYKITEIFNFQTRDRLRIVQNMETKSEAMETKGFDEFADKGALEEALAALRGMGGKADSGSISGLRKSPKL